jgi:phospholipid/cholesterol/gamma-HCH transport system permease protein
MKEQISVSDGALFLSGVLTFRSIPMIEKQVHEILEHDKPVRVDVSGLSYLDSAGVAYLETLEERIKCYSETVVLQGVPGHLAPVISTFSSRNNLPVKPPYIAGFFEKLGESVLNDLHEFVQALIMAADVFYWAIIGLFKPRGQRKGSFIQQGIILGVQALPVVALLSFIIGFIISLQTANQLRNFGANVYLADLLAISMLREMGPMMTAIILAGRSGSAIASEIASMQVSEEIDALRMMAINPIRYVVVPKFYAISVVMPVLVVFSVLVGMIGGLIIAVGYLDLSIQNFISRSIDILTMKDIIITLSKSTFFAWIIVIIGSHFGFTVKGGAEGVGKATTNSVVVAIFTVIFFDAVFSLLYL